MNAYDLNRAITVLCIIFLALLMLGQIQSKMSLPKQKRTVMISEDMLNDNFLRYVQAKKTSIVFWWDNKEEERLTMWNKQLIIQSFIITSLCD